MVDVDKAFEIKYKKHGKEVELLVDFDELQKFRENPDEISYEDVLADDKIYSDQKKGEIAPDEDLDTIFSTTNYEDIIKEILINGDCQIPTAYMNKLREEKKKQIIYYIVDNAYNPQTKTKFTYSMIEGVIDKIHTNIDPQKDVINQAEEILKKIKTKVPISMSKVLLIAKIPAQYCGKFFGEFRKYGKIKKEFFDDSGSLHLHIEISQGSLDEVENYIRKNSNSEAEYHIQRDD